MNLKPTCSCFGKMYLLKTNKSNPVFQTTTCMHIKKWAVWVFPLSLTSSRGREKEGRRNGWGWLLLAEYTRPYASRICWNGCDSEAKTGLTHARTLTHIHTHTHIHACIHAQCCRGLSPSGGWSTYSRFDIHTHKHTHTHQERGRCADELPHKVSCVRWVTFQVFVLER